MLVAAGTCGVEHFDFMLEQSFTREARDSGESPSQQHSAFFCPQNIWITGKSSSHSTSQTCSEQGFMQENVHELKPKSSWRHAPGLPSICQEVRKVV